MKSLSHSRRDYVEWKSWRSPNRTRKKLEFITSSSSTVIRALNQFVCLKAFGWDLLQPIEDHFHHDDPYMHRLERGIFANYETTSLILEHAPPFCWSLCLFRAFFKAYRSCEKKQKENSKEGNNVRRCWISHKNLLAMRQNDQLLLSWVTGPHKIFSLWPLLHRTLAIAWSSGENGISMERGLAVAREFPRLRSITIGAL